jgi:hypothetical protein
MAVLGTEIIVHKGYIPRALAADQDSAILLREMVAERYQTALKHTNVQDWFAYVNTYADMPPSVANPEMIAKYHVSPLDGGDAYWNKWQDLAGTLTPALVLKGDGHGRPDEYIYDYQEGDMHTIVIRTSDMDSPLVKTAIDYLIKPPAKQGQIVQAFTIRGNSAIAVTSRPENR